MLNPRRNSLNRVVEMALIGGFRFISFQKLSTGSTQISEHFQSAVNLFRIIETNFVIFHLWFNGTEAHKGCKFSSVFTIYGSYRINTQLLKSLFIVLIGICWKGPCSHVRFNASALTSVRKDHPSLIPSLPLLWVPPPAIKVKLSCNWLVTQQRLIMLVD